MKPPESEYPAYYHRYIAALGDVDLAEILRTEVQVIESLGALMNDDDALFRYAEGKWSIKEVLGHLIDCERVFAYRAMCIARGEAQPLPGFDEDAYVANAAFDARSLRSLVEEFTSVRNATITLMESMTSSAMQLSGTANDNPITVRALLWIIAGHTEHHLRVLRERYRCPSG